MPDYQQQSPGLPRSLQFINISHPQQAKEKEQIRIIRKHVRPVHELQGSRSLGHHSMISDNVTVELSGQGLAFVTTTHPDQTSDATIRTFVKQNSQKRGKTKLNKKMRIIDRHVGATVNSRARDVPPTVSKSLESQMVHASNTVNARLIDQEEVAQYGGGEEAEVLPSWSEILPKGMTPTRSWSLKTAQRVIKTRQPMTGAWRVLSSTPAACLLPSSVETGANLNTLLRPMLPVGNAVYPIEMTPELFKIVEYLHLDPKITHVPPAFAAVWLPVLLQDAAAFQSLLFLMTRQQAFYHGVDQVKVGLQLYTSALQSIHQRLSISAEARSMGVVTSVLMFLILDIQGKDAERFVINMAGLIEIINLRGGISSLNNHLVHRMHLIMVEVCAAYSFDHKPTYYLTGDIMVPLQRASSHEPMPECLRSQLDLLLSRSPNLSTLHSALQELYALTTHINHDGLDRFAANIAYDPAAYTLPMRFFEIMFETDYSRESAGIKSLVTVICSASIFCINIFRITLAERLSSLHHNYILRMRYAIETASDAWEGLEDLYLWCLCQGAITAWDSDRAFFVDLVRQEMSRRGETSPQGVINMLEEIFFIESLFKDEYLKFGEEIMASKDRDVSPLSAGF